MDTGGDDILGSHIPESHILKSFDILGLYIVNGEGNDLFSRKVSETLILQTFHISRGYIMNGKGGHLFPIQVSEPEFLQRFDVFRFYLVDLDGHQILKGRFFETKSGKCFIVFLQHLLFHFKMTQRQEVVAIKVKFLFFKIGQVGFVDVAKKTMEQEIFIVTEVPFLFQVGLKGFVFGKSISAFSFFSGKYSFETDGSSLAFQFEGIQCIGQARCKFTGLEAS